MKIEYLLKSINPNKTANKMLLKKTAIEQITKKMAEPFGTYWFIIFLSMKKKTEK